MSTVCRDPAYSGFREGIVTLGKQLTELAPCTDRLRLRGPACAMSGGLMGPGDTPQPKPTTTPGNPDNGHRPSSLLSDPEMGSALRTAWVWLTHLILLFVALFCIMAGVLGAYGVNNVIEWATGGEHTNMARTLVWTADAAIVIASVGVAASVVMKTWREAFRRARAGGEGNDAE